MNLDPHNPTSASPREAFRCSASCSPRFEPHGEVGVGRGTVVGLVEFVGVDVSVCLGRGCGLRIQSERARGGYTYLERL